MKRLILILIVVFAAGSLFAGDGKSCDVKHKAKSVSLTGTIAAGADDTTVFRVANSDKSYTVCHKSKANLAKLSEQMPEDVRLEVIRDQSGYIYTALHEINVHLVLGSILACAVVLLFMRSWRSTSIAGCQLRCRS